MEMKIETMARRRNLDLEKKIEQKLIRIDNELAETRAALSLHLRRHLSNPLNATTWLIVEKLLQLGIKRAALEEGVKLTSDEMESNRFALLDIPEVVMQFQETLESPLPQLRSN